MLCIGRLHPRQPRLTLLLLEALLRGGVVPAAPQHLGALRPADDSGRAALGTGAVATEADLRGVANSEK